jgi:hypothetical protein
MSKIEKRLKRRIDIKEIENYRSQREISCTLRCFDQKYNGKGECDCTNDR